MVVLELRRHLRVVDHGFRLLYNFLWHRNRWVILTFISDILKRLTVFLIALTSVICLQCFIFKVWIERDQVIRLNFKLLLSGILLLLLGTTTAPRTFS